MTNFEKFKEDVAKMTEIDIINNATIRGILCPLISSDHCVEHNGDCGACIKAWLNAEVTENG